MRIVALLIVAVFAIPRTAAAQIETYDGRPAFAAGDDLAYYVWRDADTWHVRWTTRGLLRAFTGMVESTGGKLKSLKRIDLEEERRLLHGGRPLTVVVGPRGRMRTVGGRAPVVVTREQDKIEKDGDTRIVFNARTETDVDGFDFKVDANVESLRFVLDVGGKPMPGRVIAGKNSFHPNALPLVVQLK